MAKVYYSQTDKRWADALYSSCHDKSQTIKSGGCGVTSAAMIVSSLTGQSVTPPAVASYSVKNGYRTAADGTSWGLFPALAKAYGLAYTYITDVSKAKQIVAAGGMCAVSVAGGAKGIFSDKGHIVVLAGIKDDGRAIIFDPLYYTGKYSSGYRRGKVQVDGNNCYISFANLNENVNAYFGFSTATVAAENMQAITDCTNELLWRGIAKNQPLWNEKAKANIWLQKILANYYAYIRKNGGSVKDRKLTSDEALDILQRQGILGDKSYWNDLAYNDHDVYCLLINMADYIN